MDLVECHGNNIPPLLDDLALAVPAFAITLGIGTPHSGTSVAMMSDSISSAVAPSCVVELFSFTSPSFWMATTVRSDTAVTPSSVPLLLLVDEFGRLEDLLTVEWER